MSGSVTASAQVVADRVVVEIDRIPYTQRQIEIFHFVKFGVSNSISHGAITEQTWNVVVKHFIEAMLIDQSSSVLGLFRPNAKALQQANENFAKRVEVDSVFAKQIDRLALRHRELQKIIIQVFRVESARQSKSSELARSNRGQARFSKANKAWIDGLREKAVIRFYHEAAKYIPARWPQ